jgi:hypothetical protein
MTRRRLAKELMEASGATLVRARPKEVLLANRAAQDALAPRRTRSPD